MTICNEPVVHPRVVHHQEVVAKWLELIGDPCVVSKPSNAAEGMLINKTSDHTLLTSGVPLGTCQEDRVKWNVPNGRAMR